MKRLFLLFFSALLCTAVSANDFEVDGIYYNITSSGDLTVRVTYQGSNHYDYSNEYTGSVVIPEKVTYNSKEYSVTSIGNSAFEGCSGLTSVTIPNSVTSIGEYAFQGCSGLTSVDIPNSVTSIGNSAFDDTGWYNNHSDGVLYLDNWLIDYKGTMPANTSINIKDGTKGIADSAFYGCSGLTSVTIPNSITSIGGRAFSGCKGLTSITIPNSVTSIGNSAFYGTGWYNNHSDGVLYLDNWLVDYKGTMPANTSINIKDGTKGIADSAFYGCSALTSVTIPNSVTSIGEYAFCNCSGLTSVTIPNSVTSIGDYAFSGCSGLTSINIPNSVTSIGQSAFWGCSGLTSVTIPNSVTSIGSSAFYNCSGLTSVTIGNSVTSIGESAFWGCSGLISVTIPNSVTRIGDSAFYGCSGLISVTIPNSVTSIGSSAFSGCSGLTSVTIPNSVTSIENSAFSGCSGLTSVTIPNSVTSIGESAFDGCSALTAVHITDLSAWCKIEFGNYSNPTSYAHHLYLNGEEIINLVIPDDVTSIGYSAFFDCSGLTSVTIPNSVTSIGDRAFSGCSGLTNVRIEEGESTLPLRNYVFSSCPLTTLYLGRNISYTVSGSSTPFSGKKKLSAVTIGNNVTNIGEYLFYGCSALASVTIPESCKTIQRNAFRDCNNLQELTLPSTCIACYDYSFYGCTSIEKINCQAETPPAAYPNTFSSVIYTKATLNVPEGCSDKYKAANIWKEFTNMTAGGSELKQCAAPVITYADGKLQFACETAGAEYMYTLTASDAKSSFEKSAGSVDLTACYDITAYAVAEGYKNSEKVTATLYWINGSDVSTNINQTEMRGVMATCSGGIITVSGLTDGETVMFYDANGALLYTGTAQNGTISYAPSASGVIIVKIGTTSIKVVS